MVEIMMERGGEGMVEVMTEWAGEETEVMTERDIIPSLMNIVKMEYILGSSGWYEDGMTRRSMGG